MPPTPPTVTMMDQDNVVALMNELANERTWRAGEAAQNPDLAAILNALNTRDKRREAAARLGITDTTPDNYRLVMYKDGVQHVALIGRVDEQGIFHSSSRLILPQPRGVDALDMFRTLFTQNFTPTQGNREITIPVGNSTPQGREDSRYQEQNINLTPDQQRAVTRQVTILALADQANRGDIALAESNDRLPNKRPLRDSSEERTV